MARPGLVRSERKTSSSIHISNLKKRTKQGLKKMENGAIEGRSTMINIICDICGTKLEVGTYVAIKTWGTFPTRGYVEQTIHVCSDCNGVIKKFIKSITKE